MDYLQPAPGFQPWRRTSVCVAVLFESRTLSDLWLHRIGACFIRACSRFVWRRVHQRCDSSSFFGCGGAALGGAGRFCCAGLGGGAGRAAGCGRGAACGARVTGCARGAGAACARGAGGACSTAGCGRAGCGRGCAACTGAVTGGRACAASCGTGARFGMDTRGASCGRCAASTDACGGGVGIAPWRGPVIACGGAVGRASLVATVGCRSVPKLGDVMRATCAGGCGATAGGNGRALLPLRLLNPGLAALLFVTLRLL